MGDDAILRQMGDDRLAIIPVGFGMGFCGTTMALSYIYRGQERDGMKWPPDCQFHSNDIHSLRLEYVCWHQERFKRRFWSRKLLIRLLELLVFYVYADRLEGTRMDETYKANASRSGGLFDRIFEKQTTPNLHFMVPTLRPVPKPTLLPKLEWMLDKLMASQHVVERDSEHPDEFFQHWMNYVCKQSNLPSTWFSWHNDEFPEYYEWEDNVADDDDLKDFAIEIVM